MKIAEHGSKQDFSQLVGTLNTLLASYLVFYQKLRAYHWNLVDKHFFAFHQVFENMYQDAQEKIDTLAERIRYLDSETVCGLGNALDASFVKDASEIPDLETMISNLIADLDILAEHERAIFEEASTYHDHGTEDLLGGFLRDIEKQVWMLKSSKQ